MSIFETGSTRQSTEQIVLEVVRIKLSSSLNVSKSDKTLIIGYIEAHYGRAKKYRTKENKLYGGTVFGIPYNEHLAGLTLFVSILDKKHDLTVDIAESALSFAEDSGNQLIALGSTPRDCSANLTRNKGRERFSRLVKPIHWERLKGLNLERIVHGVDVTTLMTYADDVAVGDVSQEDVDHKLLKTLQLNQYSVQYLRSCQKAMRNNKAAINEALKVFDDEEAILDLKLARMRTRSKALKREDASLDTLHTEYSDLLLALDPLLMKAYKKSLTSDSQSKKKRFLNDFASGADLTEGTDGVKGRGRSGRGSISVEQSDSSIAWKGTQLTSLLKPDGATPSPSSSWAELVSGKRDEKVKSPGSAEGENYWAKQGSWEAGQKYRPVQRPPPIQIQPLKDEDSGSDSGFGSDYRRKDRARKGSAGKDEKDRVTGSGSALLGPKVSVSDPSMDFDRPSEHKGRLEQESERMSILFDKPRVTFDSFSRSSKSEFNRESQGQGPSTGPDQDSGKSRSGEVRQSAAWSTLGSQNSMMSADSLGIPVKGATQQPVAALTAAPTVRKSIETKAAKNISTPTQSISPEPGSGPWTRRTDDYDDVEVIELGDSDKGGSSNRNETPVLRSVKVDKDDSSVNSSVVSIPTFAPVAAAISSKWSENDIGEEIARNKLYDSDSTHSSRGRSPNPQKALKSISKSQGGFSPSESDSDFSPLPQRELAKTADIRPEKKSQDPWAANKESNKFNSFLNSNSKGIAMPAAVDTEITTDSLEKPIPLKPAVEAIKPPVDDSQPAAAAKSSAYADFIQSSSEAEKKKAVESSQQLKSSSGSVASSSKAREGSKDDVASVSHGLQRKQEHEDLFERPSRMSLSSTFPGPGGLSAKQQMEQGRLSKTSSIFNSEEEDDFFDDDEGDIIDTSTSVVLDFFTMENHGSSGEGHLGIAQIPIPTTVTTDRLVSKKSVKEGSVAFKSAEVFTELTISQASAYQEGDVEDWDPKVHDPYDSNWETSKWKGKPPDAAKGLQFTIRDSEDRSSSAKVETRETNRPDSVEEEDDDVLYGTTRFGGTRTMNDEFDGTLKNTSKGSVSKSKNFHSSSPFGTLLSSNDNQKPDEAEAENNKSNASSDLHLDEGPSHHENLDSSFHPSDSANSLNFNLSQSTVLFDIEKINSFMENKEKKRENEDEKLGDSKQKKSSGVKQAELSEVSEVNEINSGLKWRTGKASVELIETGRAFEVYVGALKLHDESLLSLEFLGLRSASSPMIPQSAITTVQPVNFSSYISYAPEIITLLTDEIQAEGEYLSFRINLIDMEEDSADAYRGAETKENVLAQGSVALWVMIEDSCSILRQEVDILDCVNNKVIGFAVVDVRGHRLLKECS